MRRWARVGVYLTVGGTACAVLGWRAWERWGPVREHPMPPGAEVQQWSRTTCGPAAVATLLNTYGKPWTGEQLDAECKTTGGGASLADLREVLLRRGLAAEAVRAGRSRALLRLPRPYIAYLAAGHFVVVERWRHGRLEVFDPAAGRAALWTPEELFARSDGWALTALPR